MIYTYEIEGIPIQTGDIICTMNGKPDILPGEFWLLVGRLVPGDVDHVAIFLGPEGRCIEAGSKGVNPFHLTGKTWHAEEMVAERGFLIDTFYGAAYPLAGMQLSEEDEMLMRMKVADYCLEHIGKPYNINFLNAESEKAFYCSQLAYKAYEQIGINLNTGLAMEQLPGTNEIIYPQEIWDGFEHKAAKKPAELVKARK